MTKRTIFTLSATALMSLAMAQSDGRSFDAAVYLVPGMTVERNGVIYGGDYSQGLLQNGDVVRTDNMGGTYQILTSDGSVIDLSSNAEVTIAGGLRGFDVFQVSNGSYAVSGNAYDGYPINSYFQSLLTTRVNNTAVQNGAPYVNNSNYGVIDTPYSRVVNGPSMGVYGPNYPNTMNNLVLYPWSGPVNYPVNAWPYMNGSWWTRWMNW